MLAQSCRLDWPFIIGLFMTSLTSLAPTVSTSSTRLKIWRLVGTTSFYQSCVSSKVVTSVINTFEACGVLNIKVTSWPIPIWCGVKGTLVDMNSKDSNLLTSMVNEGLTCSTYSLSDLSPPSTSWPIIMVIGIGIVKVWTSKGMIYKHVPPLSGLIGLVTSCIIDGVVRIMLLVLVSTYTKLKGLYLKSRKAVQ
jgi:hypothetical protein